MDGKTCFFIGSRYTSDNIKEKLAEVIEKHIVEYGVTTFTVGRYGNFDSIVQGVLKDAKKRHPKIAIYLLLPYALTQKTDIPQDFDGTLYPDGLEKVPFRLAIVQANRYMIKTFDYLIAHPSIGNSRKIVEYAQIREKKVLIKVTILE